MHYYLKEKVLVNMCSSKCYPTFYVCWNYLTLFFHSCPQWSLEVVFQKSLVGRQLWRHKLSLRSPVKREADTSSLDLWVAKGNLMMWRRSGSGGCKAQTNFTHASGTKRGLCRFLFEEIYYMSLLLCSWLLLGIFLLYREKGLLHRW